MTTTSKGTMPGALALESLLKRFEHLRDTSFEPEVAAAVADLRALIARAETAEANVARLREASQYLADLVSDHIDCRACDKAVAAVRAALADPKS